MYNYPNLDGYDQAYYRNQDILQGKIQRQKEENEAKQALKKEWNEAILPMFEKMVKECREVAPSQYRIMRNDGQRFMYYPTKCRLVAMFDKGGKRQAIYLPPAKLLLEFPFDTQFHPDDWKKDPPKMDAYSLGKHRMMFGMHAGKTFSEVPKEYLKWMIENMSEDKIKKRSAELWQYILITVLY